MAINMLQSLHDEYINDFVKHGDTKEIGHAMFCTYNDISEEMSKRLWNDYMKRVK